MREPKTRQTASRDHHEKRFTLILGLHFLHRMYNNNTRGKNEEQTSRKKCFERIERKKKKYLENNKKTIFSLETAHQYIKHREPIHMMHKHFNLQLRIETIQRKRVAGRKLEAILSQHVKNIKRKRFSRDDFTPDVTDAMLCNLSLTNLSKTFFLNTFLKNFD